MRDRLIRENEALAAHSEYLRGKFVELITRAIAEDLGDATTDLRPRLVAAAAAAGMSVIEELPDEDAELSAHTFESLLAFLRGGLAALQDQDRG